MATEYPYNSTYAFQENKLGLGVELEGAELLERFKDGVVQFLTGAEDIATNQTYGKANRAMSKANTSDSQKVEQINTEGKSKTISAVNNMTEGASETRWRGFTIRVRWRGNVSRWRGNVFSASNIN